MSGSSLADIKAAAEAGNPAAQDKLAEQFILHMDTAQAESWYRKAAEQGYAHAQGKLGDLLLLHARVGFGLKPDVKAATGSEAVKWVTLAANQGDNLGQADLASAYLNGDFVRPDLLEAYKWGDLAARGSPFDPATITGRSTRDAAILKMSADQIAEAKERVATFTPHVAAKSELPEPAWVKQIELSGLSGPPNHRLAVVDNQTLAVGDSVVLKVAGKSVSVRCLEIREKSVLVQIEGLDKPTELTLADD
ncbi:MAG TPA: tetratricopeptide repeat protein [Verrucomicrobiae bacterium]|nr:tetratricopeptide repeat protein [Verrucomicrobiae bacterium]